LAVGVVYDRKYWLSVSEGGSVNDTTYVLDLDVLRRENREVWSRHTFGMRSFAACAGALDSDYSAWIGPLMGGDEVGYANKMDSGNVDPGGAISAVAKTAPLHCGTPGERKRFRKVWVTMKAQTGSVTVDEEVDFGLRTNQHTIDLTAAPAYPKIHRLAQPDKMQGKVEAIKVTHAVSDKAADLVGIELQLDERPRR
jgi:hypothetical protein